MPFDEAVELARLIRQAPGWHVLSIEPVSGETLDTDRWAVQAVRAACRLFATILPAHVYAVRLV